MQSESGLSLNVFVDFPQDLDNSGVLFCGDVLDMLEVQLLNGTLKLTDIQVSKLAVHHDNGTTLFQGVSVKAASQVTKQNGTTTMKNLTVPGLQVKVKTGGFTLNEEKQSNSYDDQRPQ